LAAVQGGAIEAKQPDTATGTSRDALFGYRLRFSPETQSIRRTTIDNIVLRSIQDLGGDSGATIGKLGRITLTFGQDIALNIGDTRAALDRLEQSAFIENRPLKRKNHWYLTSKGLEFLTDAEQHATRTRERVSTSLFGSGGNSKREVAFFFDILALMFDEITTAYLESMFSKSQSPVTGAIIKTAIGKIESKYEDVDPASVTSAAARFFAESNPDFDWIKWTYCKNYYAVRAIGLGAGADVLSAELFKGATFYLDTNVLIAGLDEGSPRFLQVRQVVSGIKRIGCKAVVIQPTVFELRDYVSGSSANLERALEQIPDALLARVSGPFARAEAHRRFQTAGPSPDEILAVYNHAEDQIVTRLGAEIVEDEWFDIQRESAETRALAGSLQRHYRESTQRSKTEAAALHDAIALAYIEEQDTRHHVAGYFLTLDLSLPKYKPVVMFEGVAVNRAITLDSLMPWMGAISTDDNEAATALSVALANQLMPSGGQFSIQEFRMLAELGMDCGKMPAEDVEQCLLYLRREARNLTLTKAEDRELLHGLVRGFFSSPDRKYLSELVELNARLDRAEAQIDHERTLRRAEEDLRRQLQEGMAEERRTARVKRRLGAAAMAFALLELAVLAIANKYGEGENLLQKVGSMSWLFALVGMTSVGWGRWLCRGELWETAKRMIRPFKT